jgi:SAM-dependent methyltransferase
MWDKGWDDVFRHKEWGRYPPEELVRFVGRTFFGAADRSAVRFLEIGCGPGANIWFLAREGFTVTGLDGSSVALDRAAGRLADDGLRVELNEGDAMEMPFDDGTFDCVLDIECIYANTREDSLRIIDETYRVLKTGGWLFSKTFMTGVTGEETAVALPGEPHTYRDIRDGPFNQGYGPIRLTAEDDIAKLYGAFSSIAYDSVVRTDANRTKKLGEWLITCRK